MTCFHWFIIVHIILKKWKYKWKLKMFVKLGAEYATYNYISVSNYTQINNLGEIKTT